MSGSGPMKGRGRFQRIFISYLVISLVPLLLGLVVFQRAIDNLEDAVYRYHRQLLEEYRQVTDGVLAACQNMVTRLTWDDLVTDLGRAGPVARDANVTLLLPEISKRLEKIVTLESSYLDVGVYASASGAVATSQFSFVEWDRFYDVFFAADGMSPDAFQWMLRDGKTVRFQPLSVRRLVSGHWVSQDVLFYAMPFPIVGTPMGKVFALVSLDRLTQPMRKLASQGVDAMFILDKDAGKIASMGSISDETLTSLRDFLEGMTPGTPSLLTVDGRRTLAIMETSQTANMRYVMFVEYENLFGVVLAVRNAMYVLLAASCLLIIGSAAYFSWKQASQYSHLAIKTDEMEAWLDAQKTALADVFVDKLLRDEFADEASMRDFCRRIDLPEMTGKAGVVLVRFDLLSHQADARQRIDLGKLLLQDMIREKCIPCYAGNLDDRRMAVILGGFDTPEAFAAFADALFAALPERLEKKLDVYATAAASADLSGLMELHFAYRQSLHALDDTKGPGLRWIEAERESRDALWYPLSQEEIIISSVRKGGTDQLAAALDRLYQVNWEQRTLTLPMYEQLIALLRGTALRCLQACDDPSLPTAPLKEALTAFGEYGSVSLGFAQIQKALMDLSEMVRGSSARKGGLQMDEIMRFIAEHQAESSLSLSVVAGHFHLSEPYLSRVFKEASGVNYSDYLEGLRIARACQLLSEGMSIQQIAKEVGYNSVPVFRNAFKRVTGTTPGAYEK